MRQMTEFERTAPIFVSTRSFPKEPRLWATAEDLAESDLLADGYIKHWSERLRSFVYLHSSRWEIPAMGDPRNLQLFDLEVIAHSRSGESAHRLQALMRRALEESGPEIEASDDLNRWVRRLWDGSDQLAGKYGPAGPGR